MLWLKAFHLIFMVTLVCLLFYLPRLYVYHAMSDDDISNERFKIMERKLFFGIMTPGMIATFIFGIWMLVDYAWELHSLALAACQNGAAAVDGGLSFFLRCLAV